MEQPIEERRDRGGVPEQLAPVVYWSIRGQNRRRSFIAAHDELEQVLGGRVWQLPHAQVVDDEERHGGQVGDKQLPGAVDGGLGQGFDEQVRFTVDDPIALLNRGPADGLG